ncbi:DUF2283 domain-containing protein [Kaistia granuli]|uniref:DUF2283 domain-containing protein n=1 Tax=Kaistia granuli TaxID=363259 RepID=UPI00037EE6AF|nr:DUF2283 domain-containing protein [Kaistia granuli]
MKTVYDSEADALYLRFTDAPIIESEEIRPGLVLDFDQNGKIVGVEILDASQHLAPGTDLERLAAA